MGKVKELIAYQKAYQLAMEIFQVSKKFPPEELYALTNQIRRSARSVCANLAEGYRRRKYPNYFLSKLNDCETENAEVEIWLDFAKDCNYISDEEYQYLVKRNTEIGKLLWFIRHNPEKFS